MPLILTACRKNEKKKVFFSKLCSQYITRNVRPGPASLTDIEAPDCLFFLRPCTNCKPLLLGTRYRCIYRFRPDRYSVPGRPGPPDTRDLVSIAGSDFTSMCAVSSFFSGDWADTQGHKFIFRRYGHSKVDAKVSWHLQCSVRPASLGQSSAALMMMVIIVNGIPFVTGDDE